MWSPMISIFTLGLLISSQVTVNLCHLKNVLNISLETSSKFILTISSSERLSVMFSLKRLIKFCIVSKLRYLPFLPFSISLCDLSAIALYLIPS